MKCLTSGGENYDRASEKLSNLRHLTDLSTAGYSDKSNNIDNETWKTCSINSGNEQTKR